jgi:hypothetical protein
MRATFLLPTLVVASVLFAQDSLAQRKPSELYSTPKKFLVTSKSDMRLFICDKPTLDDRVRRKVCLIDSVTSRSRTNSVILEVAVGDGPRLEAKITGRL